MPETIMHNEQGTELAKALDRAAIEWTPAPQHLRDFNGLRQTTVIGRSEYGVFRERHPGGFAWAVRVRPLDSTGVPTDCWGHAFPTYTKAEAVGYVEKQARR